MRPISRRHALQVGSLGLAATVTGGAGMLYEGSRRFDPAPGGAPIAEPIATSSADGLLDVRLVVSEGDARIAGRTATTLRYNGGVPGPTLLLRPGDRLRVELVNRLSVQTNLHVHGLHVSPSGNSDNVFVTVEPGGSHRYDYQLPDDHPPGVYWYHPHHHESVADQVFGGLYGAIIVADPRSLPVSRYLKLGLDGQQLRLLGVDSGRFPRPAAIQTVLLAPGNRADLLVTTAAGTSHLRALPYDRGTAMGMGNVSTPSATFELATLTVAGATAAPLPAFPAQPARRDLSRATLTGRRELLLGGMGMGMGSGAMQFTIDGKSFDSGRVDQTVTTGAVEEWTLTNNSSMDHPFHLHVWPMQLMESGSSPRTEPTWQDVVNVPARGRTTVRIAFDDFPGTTVYHCHILDHEDKGMMGIISALEKP